MLDLGRIWARIKMNMAQIWASSGLFYLFIFMADMRPSYGLILAQILQTGADRPSANIPYGMWAR